MHAKAPLIQVMARPTRLPILRTSIMTGRFEVADRRTVLTAAIAAGALGTAAYRATRPSYSDAVTGVWTSPKPGDLPEADYLVHYARLAASSHNTQPLVFRVRKGGIDILPDVA